MPAAALIGRPGGFTEQVLDLVAAIPPGTVMTYGDVAAVLGSRAARAVGTILSRAGHDVPWWRVVQASGRVARGHDHEALHRLRRENTPLVELPDGWRVLMSQARHSPE